MLVEEAGDFGEDFLASGTNGSNWVWDIPSNA
jgi:hypothetical protein